MIQQQILGQNIAFIYYFACYISWCRRYFNIYFIYTCIIFRILQMSFV